MLTAYITLGVLLCMIAKSTICDTILPSTQSYGKFEGFGVSLAWFGNVFGERDDISDALFTLNPAVSINELNDISLPGLGFTIARYNVGACSYNTAPDGSEIQLSPNIPGWKQIEGYWLDWSSADPESNSWVWNVDATQRTALNKAIERGANIIEFFSNSPMWWMLNNHNPSGSDDGASDNLQSWNYNQHAVYMATVVEHFSTHFNITATSVDPFNEPIADWWAADGTQEGCHFDHSTQAAVLALLRPELDKRGLQSVSIAASDESFVDMALDTWNSFDTDTQALVDIINVHGYEGTDGDRRGLYEAATAAGKVLRNSEHGDGDGSGQQLAQRWMMDFTQMHVSAMSYWQALDGGGWGLLDADLNYAQVKAANRKYFVVAQFSRHIRPGMELLDAGDPSGMTVVAYDAALQRMVLVTTRLRVSSSVGSTTEGGTGMTATKSVSTPPHTNRAPSPISEQQESNSREVPAYGAQSEQYIYDLSAFSQVLGPVSGWVTDLADKGASGGEGNQLYVARNDTAHLTEKTLFVEFSPLQIQTIQIDNVIL